MSSSWRRALYLLLVIGVFLGAWSYYFPDSAIGGVVMNKVNTYRLNQGLVGWWTFDGTDLNFQTNRVTDHSGNNNFGRMENMSTSTSRIAGKMGQALQFDAVDDLVSVANQPNLNFGTNSFSVGLWVRAKLLGTYQGIVSKMAYNFGDGWYVRVSNGDFVEMYARYNLGTYGSVQGTALTPNDWRYYVFVVDRANHLIRAYENGRQVDTLDITGWGEIDASDNYDLLVGALRKDSYEKFSGDVDDVRIYNRALSAAEVKLLYTSTAGSKMNASRNTIPGSTLQTGLVGLWSFDGPDVTDKVYDRSGQGNHGYFNGGATSSAKVAGKVGQALSFRVGLDEVDVGSAASLDNIAAQGGGGMTISAWIRPTQGMVTNGAIATKGYGGSNGWSFRLIENSGSYGLRFSSSFDGGTDIDTWSNYGTIALNAWQHVVVTWDGSTNANNLYTYLNSIDITDNRTNGVGNRDSDAAQRAFIGDGSFSGTIDDVRVYNRALSAGEVKDLYNATVGTKVNHSQNTVPGSTLQQGLVGLWSFDGPDLNSRTNTAYDRSGQGNNGEMVNMSTSTSRVPGKVGQALQFDGVDDYVEVNGNSSLNSLPAMSISVWMNPKSFGEGGQGMIASKSLSYSEQGWRLQLHYASDYLQFFVPHSGTDLTVYSSDSTVVLNEWSHWVITWGGSISASSVHIYKNGQEVTGSGTSATGSRGSDSGVLAIGDEVEIGNTRSFDGILDEVRVYNRILTPAEVKLLYNLGR